MTTRGTEDFASSAMVRVLVRGMAELGLRPPVVLGDLGQATVPLHLKSAIVKSAIEQGGLTCLPMLGRGLHELAMEPTHLALTAGNSAQAMLVRWQRLERYIHSKHIIRILELKDNFALVEHVHKANGPNPLAVEDLVVCGVLCALLEANGLQSVAAHANGVELFPYPDERALSNFVQQAQTGQWALSWSGSAPAPSSQNRLDAWAQVAPKVWSPFASSVGDLVAGRLPELLQIDEVASNMGMSRRSFQRALATEELNFQRLQTEVRFRLAGWHLLQHKTPIAEIGFVCGYSDQAHLTREFKQRVGVPPAKYRELFGAN